MPGLEALMEQLSDEQLEALCRELAGQPVRASDVPVGVPTPTPDRLGAMLMELGRRRVMATARLR